jgi:hypothetical protein
MLTASQSCVVLQRIYNNAVKCYDTCRRESRKRWTLQGTKGKSILFTSHIWPVSVFLHQHKIKHVVGEQHRPFRWQHIHVFSWGCRCHHAHRKQDLYEQKNLVLVYISYDSSQKIRILVCMGSIRKILVVGSRNCHEKNWFYYAWTMQNRTLMYVNYDPSQKTPLLVGMNCDSS